MSKKLLIVQPHSDDALFCASSKLMNYSGDIILFTVENNEKRLAEDLALCDVLGIKKLITSQALNFEDKSYYHYYKEMGFKDFNEKDSNACIIDYFGKKKVAEIKKEIRETCEEYKKRGYKIMTCLGVGHPTHWLVRDSLLDIADYFYRDFPHSYKRKGLKNFENSVFKMVLSEEIQLTEDEHSLKFDLAYNIYKTQRSLLFFEQGYIKKNIPEQFYKLK